MADIGKLLIKIGVDLDDLKKGVGKAQDVVSGLGGKLGGAAAVLSGAFTAGVLAATAAIAGLVTGVGLVVAGMAGVAKAGLEAFIPFQKGMNEVFTLLPDISEEAMGKLKDDTLAAAKEIGVLPDKIVPALYQALSAGVPPGNVIDFLKEANKGAVGGVTDLTTSVDGLSSVLNAYHMPASKAAEVNDKMFTAVRLGKTTYEELSKSLFNVLPVASSLGVKFDDVTAAIAAMTAQGVPTSVATTQLRQLMVELSTSGTDVANAFEAISGKTFQEFIAEGGNLQGALQMIEGGFVNVGDKSADIAKVTERINDLKDKLEVATLRQSEFTSSTKDSTRAALENQISDYTEEIASLESKLGVLNTTTGGSTTSMKDLFSSVEAGQAAMILTGGGTETFSKDLDAMAESAGAADKAYETMDKSISRTIEKLQAAGQVLLVEIGEKLAPVFGDMLNEVLQMMPQISESVLSVVDQIIPMLQGAFGWFKSTAIPWVTEAFTNMMPVVLGFITWFRDTLVPSITNVFNLISPKVQAFFSWFKETAIPWIQEFATRAGEVLTRFFDTFDLRFGPSIKRLEESIGRVAEALGSTGEETDIIGGILKTFELIIDGVTFAFDHWTRSVEYVSKAIKFVVDVLRALKDALQPVIDLLPKLVGSPLFALTGGRTFQQTFGFAEGGQFVVPPGYPNDSFMMGVTSGEFVSVTPANQVRNDNRQVNMTINSRASTENLYHSYQQAAALIP